MLVLLAAPAGAGCVAGDFFGQTDDIVGLFDLANTPVVILEDADPFFIQKVVHQAENPLRRDTVGTGEVNAEAAHFLRQLEILHGLLPAEIKRRFLPTEADDGHDFVPMENLNDGFAAVAVFVGAVEVNELVFPGRQVGIVRDGDVSDRGFGPRISPAGTNDDMAERAWFAEIEGVSKAFRRRS